MTSSDKKFADVMSIRALLDRIGALRAKLQERFGTDLENLSSELQEYITKTDIELQELNRKVGPAEFGSTGPAAGADNATRAILMVSDALMTQVDIIDSQIGGGLGFPGDAILDGQANLTGALRTLSEALQTANQELDELTGRVGATENDITALEAKVGTVDFTGTHFPDTVTDLTKASTNLDERVQENKTTLGTLEPRVTALESFPHAQMETDIQNLQTTTQTLSGDLDALETTVSNTQAELEELAGSKGQPDGLAPLDANGTIPSTYLPSYVDDVVDYDTRTDFPAAGEGGKIYVDKATNKTYRWSGTDYVAISSDLALGETDQTAFSGAAGKALRESLQTHTQDTSNPHAVSKAQVGLGNVDNTTDADKPISTAVNTALGDRNFTGTNYLGSVTNITAALKALDTAVKEGGTAYELPTATDSVKGGVIVGDGISVSAGTISHPVSEAGSKSSGLYKITTDKYGHVSVATAVSGTDIANAHTSLFTNNKSAGPVENLSPDYGGKFSVPYVSINTKGHVNQLYGYAITMPSLPSASDIGALPITGGAISGNLNVTGNLQENGARVYSSKNPPPVDTNLSPTSTNPVQNAAVYKELVGARTLATLACDHYWDFCWSFNDSGGYLNLMPWYNKWDENGNFTKNIFADFPLFGTGTNRGCEFGKKGCMIDIPLPLGAYTDRMTNYTVTFEMLVYSDSYIDSRSDFRPSTSKRMVIFSSFFNSPNNYKGYSFERFTNGNWGLTANNTSQLIVNDTSIQRDDTWYGVEINVSPDISGASIIHVKIRDQYDTGSPEIANTYIKARSAWSATIPRIQLGGRDSLEEFRGRLRYFRVTNN